MSLIHQALTRPLPALSRASRYNPLHRRAPTHAGLQWWALALIAVALSGVLLWAPWQTQTVAAQPVANVIVDAAIHETANNETPQPPPPMAETISPTPAEPPTPSSEVALAQNSAQATPPPAPRSTTQTSAPPEPVSAASASPKPTLERVQSQSQPEPAETTLVSVNNRRQDRVQAALEVGNMAQAEAELRQWITASPNAEQPRLWLAKLLLSQARFDAVGAVLAGQSSFEARGLLALWHERAGRPAMAVELFEQLARAQPRQGQWQLHWAINAENSGQLALARLLYHTYLTQFEADNPALTAFANERVRSLEEP